MDVSYNPHAERARRKIRSATNLNHLTLAPLTSRLPINDDELFDDFMLHPSTSYLQGRSAPATPRLLASSARSPRARSRAQSHASPGLGLGLEGLMTKSTSSPHIADGQTAGGRRRRRRAVSGSTTPRRRQQQHQHQHHQQQLQHQHQHQDEDAATDGDWLLRTGAFMAIEAREYKGQSWLASRQSSTSLAGLRSAEEEAFEHDLYREREMTSRRASRRGSAAADDDVSLLGSRMPSRMHSRSGSVVAASRSRIMTPSNPASMTLALDRGATTTTAAAAAAAAAADEGFLFRNSAFVEPDFVDLDEKLENLERDTLQDDEADVRKLMRRSNQGRGRGSWFANMIGWSLFSVEEHEGEFDGDDGDGDDSSDNESLDGDGAHADDDDDDDFGDGRSRDGRSGWLKRHCEGPLDPDELVPPPETNQGGWSDAAWLLSVATKVIF